MKLVEVDLHDAGAGVGKLDGYDVVVAGAAKLVGKKAKAVVGAVLEGQLLARLADAPELTASAITFESEAEKPTRAPRGKAPRHRFRTRRRSTSRSWRNRPSRSRRGVETSPMASRPRRGRGVRASRRARRPRRPSSRRSARRRSRRTARRLPSRSRPHRRRQAPAPQDPRPAGGREQRRQRHGRAGPCGRRRPRSGCERSAGGAEEEDASRHSRRAQAQEAGRPPPREPARRPSRRWSSARAGRNGRGLCPDVRVARRLRPTLARTPRGRCYHPSARGRLPAFSTSSFPRP